MKSDRFLPIGLILLITGILLGALGAHALQKHLSAQQVESFKTGISYQLLHSVLFIAFGLFQRLTKAADTFSTGLYIVLVGVLMFSVSIYVLSTFPIHGISVKWAGPVTPLGGVLMITGWSIVLIRVMMSKNS